MLCIVYYNDQTQVWNPEETLIPFMTLWSLNWWFSVVMYYVCWVSLQLHVTIPDPCTKYHFSHFLPYAKYGTKEWFTSETFYEIMKPKHVLDEDWRIFNFDVKMTGAKKSVRSNRTRSKLETSAIELIIAVNQWFRCKNSVRSNQVFVLTLDLNCHSCTVREGIFLV